MLEQGNVVRREQCSVRVQPKFHIPMHCLVGKRGRGVNLSQVKRLGKDVLIFVSASLHPTLIAIDNELN